MRNTGRALAPFLLKSYAEKFEPIRDAYEIDVRDFCLDKSSRAMASNIRSGKYDLVCFSAYLWNANKTIEVATLLKIRAPALTIIVGGPEVSHCGREYLERIKPFDILVQGEGEATFAELLVAGIEPANCPEYLAGVKSLVYRDGEVIFQTPPRPPFQNLGDIPSPILNGVLPLDRIGRHLAAYETFRGCPYSCGFCSWGLLGSVRYFPLERVESELRKILASPLDNIWVVDSIANVNKKRFKEVLRILNENNTSHKRITLELYADLLDDETIDLLGGIKRGTLACGLQTINPATLKLANRRLNLEKFAHNIRRINTVKSKDLLVQVDVVCGLPGDTYQDYLDTIRYAMKLEAGRIYVGCLAILPGSTYHKDPASFGIVFEKEAPYRALETNTFSAQDFRNGYQMMHRLTAAFHRGLLSPLYSLSRLTGESAFDLLFEMEAYLVEKMGIRHLGDLQFPDNIELYPGTEPEGLIARVLGTYVSNRLKGVVVKYTVPPLREKFVKQKLSSLAGHSRYRAVESSPLS